eukprot:m.66369 g.66369  ORF g.66369 m.66369 type:complete len:156 (+) comp13747_c0_seq1:56-523(+)
MAEGQGQGIQLSSLPTPELQNIRQQLDAEVKYLQQSLQQLKDAQLKFVQSRESLAALKPENEEREVMLPITTSMYAPARLCAQEKVIVDIGTGYYAEKSPEKAGEYFDRRISYLKDQLDSLQQLMMQKNSHKNVVEDMLSHRMRAEQQKQQQQAK